MFQTLKTFVHVKSNYMKKKFSLLVLNSLNLKTELGSCKILFQSNDLLKELSILFFNIFNLKTDLLVLCSSFLLKFFVQFFCSGIVFKTLKTFAGVKSNYMIKEFSLFFLNSFNLKSELGSCIILFQSNYLLKELSLLFLNSLNLKTKLGSCIILFQSNYLLKGFSPLYLNLLNLKPDLLVLCSSFLFKFFVQVFCSSFLFKFFVQVFCSSILFKTL